MTEPCELDLGSLVDGRPGLTPHEGGCHAECAVVSLERNGHQALPHLRVTGLHANQCGLVGPIATDQMRRAHGDHLVAVERGACGIALLLMERFEQLTILERSRIGTGFDYWLGPLHDNPSDVGDNFLRRSNRLEVSGIGTATGADIRRCVERKTSRLRKYPNPLTAFVVVVEFSGPEAQVIRHERGS